MLYACLNMFLNWFNSWALQPKDKMFKFPFWTSWQFECGGFSYSFFYAWFHTVSSVIGACVMMKLKPPQSGWPTLKQALEYKTPILLIATAHVTNIGLNNVSLVFVSLFINQVIKSLAPFPTMVAEYFLVNERQTWQIICSVFVLVVGAILSIHFESCGTSNHTDDHCGDTGKQILGFVLVVIATVASSLKPVFGALVMKGLDKPKLEPSLILFYEQCVSCMLMLCLAIFECFWNPADPTPKLPFEYLSSEGAWKGYFIIIVGSTTAFFYNLAVYYFTRAASALAVMISSNFVKILVIVLSAVQDSSSTTALNVVGICIFLCGIVSYAYLSYMKKRKPVASKGLEAGLKGPPVSEATPLNGSEGKVCCQIM